MTIDIHKIITGNPISKNLMKPWGSNSKPNSLRGKLFNRYTGPGNPVRKQVDFNPYTGQIYKVYDPPSSNNDRCSMIHDIMYTVAENIGKDSKDIKNRKLDALNNGLIVLNQEPLMICQHILLLKVKKLLD